MTGRLLTLIISILIVSCADNEAIRPYIKSNLTPLSTINPDSTDFSDLASIDKAIGDAKIVMLGEQDHGDAPTFLAKTRLIKFLHEKKGFNVLAFESDFFSLNQGWDNVAKNDDSIRSFLKTNIFSMWTKCFQCKELFHSYLPFQQKTPTPIQVTGFDNQFSGTYGSTCVKGFVNDFLEKTNIHIVKSNDYKTIFLPSLDNLYRKSIDNDNPDYFEKLEAITDSILFQISDVSDKEFGKLILRNLKSFFKQARLRGTKESREARDIQMASNLNWLIQNKFPNEKIIIWAANAHIFKNCHESFRSDKLKRKTMGDIFTANPSFSNITYVMGFTSKTGMAGRLGSDWHYVDKPEDESLESWVNNNVRYAFIDFRPFNKQYSSPPLFYMKGHHESNLANWTNIYDGVFYIRDMYPCDKTK